MSTQAYKVRGFALITTLSEAKQREARQSSEAKRRKAKQCKPTNVSHMPTGRRIVLELVLFAFVPFAGGGGGVEGRRGSNKQKPRPLFKNEECFHKEFVFS